MNKVAASSLLQLWRGTLLLLLLLLQVLCSPVSSLISTAELVGFYKWDTTTAPGAINAGNIASLIPLAFPKQSGGTGVGHGSGYSFRVFTRSFPQMTLSSGTSPSSTASSFFYLGGYVHGGNDFLVDLELTDPELGTVAVSKKVYFTDKLCAGGDTSNGVNDVTSSASSSTCHKITTELRNFQDSLFPVLSALNRIQLLNKNNSNTNNDGDDMGAQMIIRLDGPNGTIEGTRSPDPRLSSSGRASQPVGWWLPTIVIPIWLVFSGTL
jgi:hypothetical protein